MQHDPKRKRGDFWMSLLGLQLPPRIHACRQASHRGDRRLRGPSRGHVCGHRDLPQRACVCSQGFWVAPCGLSRGINLKAASPKTLSCLLSAVSGPIPPPSCSLVGTDTMVGLGCPDLAQQRRLTIPPLPGSSPQSSSALPTWIPRPCGDPQSSCVN